MLSTTKQRQQIGYFRQLLKYDDEIYYEILTNNYGVKTSKNLTKLQADCFIKKLKIHAIQLGKYKPKNDYKFQHGKYEKLGNRHGMATPKQLRMIEAMWFTISEQKTDEDRANALNHFLYRICGKLRMIFLTPEDIRKLVKAMQKMKEQKRGVLKCTQP